MAEGNSLLNCRTGLTRTGGSNPPLSVSSGLADPYGLAIDAAGDLFGTNSNAGTVSEYLTNGTFKAVFTVTGVSTEFEGVAVDAAGNLFIHDHLQGLVFEAPVSGPVKTLATGLDIGFDFHFLTTSRPCQRVFQRGIDQ